MSQGKVSSTLHGSAAHLGLQVVGIWCLEDCNRVDGAADVSSWQFEARHRLCHVLQRLLQSLFVRMEGATSGRRMHWCGVVSAALSLDLCVQQMVACTLRMAAGQMRASPGGCKA